MLTAVVMISAPLLCWGQSTLNFPRIMLPQEFSSTGFAIVNPGAAAATISFTLYGEDGSVQQVATETVPGRGQLSKLAREIFPFSTSSGWIQATASAGGLQGFWFGGDFVSRADGAEAAPSSTELVLPLITAQSEIHIANTGATDITVRLNLLGADGFDSATPFPQWIPAKGFLKADMSSIFHPEDPASPSHLRITCPCANAGFAATVITRDFLAAPSWAVANGVPAAAIATTIYFPYFVEGPQGNANWRSLLGLTNLSKTAPNSVDITVITDGRTIRSQQTIAPNGGLRLPVRDLVGASSSSQTGWARVSSTSGLPLTGYMAYADVVAAGVAVVPPQQDAQTSLLFAHIADLTPWLTGMALLNSNAAPANIDVFAMTPSGSLIGSHSFSLPSGASTARLLRELIPQTQTREADGGFLFVRSNLPIHGIELFFSRNLNIIANVGAGRLAPGITFEPPSR